MPGSRTRTRKLSQEEEVKIKALVDRKWRYGCIAEEHAAVARKQGKDVYLRAYNEAKQILESRPRTGHEITYPPPGTDMEAFYRDFEPMLNSDAQTPTDHMVIALTVVGLMSVTVTCEYAYLSVEGQHEVDIRLTERETEDFQARTANRHAPAPQPLAGLTPNGVRQLPVLRGLNPDEEDRLVRITPNQVRGLLKDFSMLHHKILWDNDGEMTYKVVSANYSMTSPSIDSYEVQSEGCSSAVTVSSREFAQMLAGSSVIPT